jgi:hypothetical protein
MHETRCFERISMSCSIIEFNFNKYNYLYTFIKYKVWFYIRICIFKCNIREKKANNVYLCVTDNEWWEQWSIRYIFITWPLDTNVWPQDTSVCPGHTIMWPRDSNCRVPKLKGMLSYLYTFIKYKVWFYIRICIFKCNIRKKPIRYLCATDNELWEREVLSNQFFDGDNVITKQIL